MNKFWNIKIEYFILLVLIGTCKLCLGLNLNITERCISSRVHCVLTNISSSYSDPLVVVDTKENQLTELIIRNTVLVHLPRELLQKSPNLKTLVIHNVGINRLQILDFEHCSQLQKLIFQFNRLSDVPEKVFEQLIILEELHLGFNMIHLVHSKSFIGLEHLKYLDLQHNSIQQLGESLFTPLKYLEHIDLSNNEIEKIDSSTFATNSNLKTILLNNNKFKVFEPNSFDQLVHLNFLDLSNTILEELNLQSVDTLLVQNSGLKRCNIFGSVIKLHGSNNKLNTLAVKEKQSVRDLELRGNLFESLDDFTGMLNLQHLDLSKNYITSLNTAESPLELPELNYLNIAFNRIENVTAENFLLLHRLVHLDLAFNHLSQLDASSFEPLKSLEKFYIDGNRISVFDYKDFFETHHLLKEVGLSGNSWTVRDSSLMLRYISTHSLQLVSRFHIGNDSKHFLHSPKTTTIALDQNYQEPQEHSVNVSSTNTNWAAKDVLALVTLILIFFILLLLILRILREEQCLQNCFRGNTFHLGQHYRRHRLDEEVSEV